MQAVAKYLPLSPTTGLRSTTAQIGLRLINLLTRPTMPQGWPLSSIPNLQGKLLRKNRGVLTEEGLPGIGEKILRGDGGLGICRQGSQMGGAPPGPPN